MRLGSACSLSALTAASIENLSLQLEANLKVVHYLAR